MISYLTNKNLYGKLDILYVELNKRFHILYQISYIGITGYKISNIRYKISKLVYQISYILYLISYILYKISDIIYKISILQNK